jgi:hypothetical protein
MRFSAHQRLWHERVDSSINAMEMPDQGPLLDRSGSQSKFDQLIQRQDSMLPAGECNQICLPAGVAEKPLKFFVFSATLPARAPGP